jgi:hypothetical protein
MINCLLQIDQQKNRTIRRKLPSHETEFQ